MVPRRNMTSNELGLTEYHQNMGELYKARISMNQARFL